MECSGLGGMRLLALTFIPQSIDRKLWPTAASQSQQHQWSRNKYNECMQAG